MNGPKSRTDNEVRISRIVADNTRRLRESQGLSIRGLAAKIQANGHRMGPSSLTRIELGVHAQGSLRAVTVDELVWLAEAFGITPEALLTRPKCVACLDTPPPGFTCRTCGAES